MDPFAKTTSPAASESSPEPIPPYGHDRPTFIEAQDSASHRLGLGPSLLLLMVSLASLVPGIQVSFFDRDEGWYAQVSREMLQSGDWLTPRYLGEVWLAKPPLLYWLVAGSFRFLGVGEWQARLVPVAAGCFAVLLTATLGARLLGRRTGILAGLLLATTGLLAIVGRMLLTDGPMLACTLGAVLLAWRMRDRPTLRCSTAYWLLIGLGVLAKGPATLMFAGAFGMALLVAGWRRWVLSPRYWLTLPLAIAVAAPWYILMARQAGGTLVHQFLWFEILSRVTGAPHGHGGPPGYYLLLSLAGLLPWTVFVPGALLASWTGRSDPRIKLLLVWLAFPWLILELIHAKLPHYILPCYCPLAILLGWQFSAVWNAAQRLDSATAAQQRVLRLWPQIMIVLGAGLVMAGSVLEVRTVGHALFVTGLLLAGGFAVVLFLLHRRRTRSAFATAIVTSLAFQIILGTWLLPTLEPLRLSRRIAESINAVLSQSAKMPVFLCGYEEPTTFFYLNAPARPVGPDELPDTLRSLDGPCLLAITDKARDALPREFASAIPDLNPASLSGLNYVKMKNAVVQIVVVPAHRFTAGTPAESASAPTR